MPSSYSSLNDLSSFTVIKDVLYLPSVGVLFPASGTGRMDHSVLDGNHDAVDSLTSSSRPSDRLDKQQTKNSKPIQPKVLLRCVSAGQFDSRHLTKGRNGESSQLGKLGEHIRLIVTPEIQISATENVEDGSVVSPSQSTSKQRPRTLSHSSAMTLEPSLEQNLLRASSETSLGSNNSQGSGNSAELKNSRSEDGGLFSMGTNVLDSLRNLPTPTTRLNNILASPGSVKGNQLASMFAKGVQQLGANLDPRKKTDSNRKESISSTHNADEEDLTSQTKFCTNTRIIQL